MKKIIILALLTVMLSTGSYSASAKVKEYEGSRITDIWSLLLSDAYDLQIPLPQKKVSAWSMLKRFAVFHAAKRTLASHEDILPPFAKLVHANGVCALGEWKIDADLPLTANYSGYFRSGSHGIIIARLSSALSKVKSGDRRIFGFAGKIFPTTDVNEAQLLKPANFFTMENFPGNKNKYFSDAILTNAPKLDFKKLFKFIPILPIGVVVGPSFLLADSNPLYRQLYEIARLGESEQAQYLSPKILKLTAETDLNANRKADTNLDFRMEILQSGGMTFNIDADGQKIGQIHLKEFVASRSCDMSLHFHHPHNNPSKN